MKEKRHVGILEKIVPVLLLVSIALSFAVGILWQKVTGLESGKTATAVVPTGAQQAATGETAQAISLDTVKGLFKKDLIKLGDDRRKVLFVEISDPSCPYCSIAAGKNPELNKSASGGRFTLVADGGTYVAPVPEIKKLVDEKKASFVYIYSPGHGNGEMGMRALYCANEKGKFWEVSDLLMSAKGYDLLNNTIKNDKTKAKELAEFLSPAFKSSDMQKCLESNKYDNRLTSDTQVASSLGIEGTPFFAVNATKFAGAYSFKDMEAVVNAALK